MEYLISMYIDNELDLDEKREFVEHIHVNSKYKDTALSLLDQEKNLHEVITAEIPEVTFKESRKFSLPPVFVRSVGLAMAVSLLIVFSVFLHDFRPNESLMKLIQATTTHRFVIYQTGIEKVELTGSFTNWQRVALQPVGATGYWEATFELPVGEHRFVYILDDNRIFADPTVLARETDDYGATNSIITIEEKDYEI